MRAGAAARAAGRVAAMCIEALAVALVVAWLAGRIVSDRYAWSQWLLWIPAPAAFLAAAAAATAACRRSQRPRVRRARIGIWALVGAVIGFHFGLVENRFLRGAGAGPGPRLRVVHASVHETGPGVRGPYAGELRRLGGDVAIVNCLLPTDEAWRIADDIDGPGKAVVTWPFLLVSRVPVLEARHLLETGDIHVAIFRLDATAELGRPITVYAVDLPSDPRIGRAATARRVRALLDGVQAAPPDLVVGDFNMTRGGAALATLFPGMEHAFDQAGTGHGASFHRAFPLYHIDHVLLAGTLRATRYQLDDPGFGRHLIQVVEVAPQP